MALKSIPSYGFGGVWEQSLRRKKFKTLFHEMNLEMALLFGSVNSVFSPGRRNRETIKRLNGILILIDTAFIEK